MRLTGAGVLAYTVHRGEVLVLLGRERDTPGWRQGSKKWSGFSGKVEANEDAIQGAAREFAEEACACVPIGGIQLPARISDVAEMLRRHAWPIEKITLAKGEELVYCTYVVRVPHAPYEQIFAQTRTRLLELDLVFRNFYRIKKLASSAPHFFFPGFVLTSKITTVGLRVLNAAEVEVRMHEEGRSEDLLCVFACPVGLAASLRNVQHALDYLHFFVSGRAQDPIFSHPAVVLITSRSCVVNAHVNKAYLEKCELRWWKLSALTEAHACARGDTDFRKLFLENLTTVATCIAQAEGIKYQ